MPACTAYASALGMTYTDFKMVGVSQASTVVCVLTQTNGMTLDLYLSQVVPYVTSVLVGFALSPEFTLPAFAVLLALVRVGWYRRTLRVGA